MAIAINAETLECGREDFLRGYVEAMLWANTWVDEPGGEGLGDFRDVSYWYQGPGRWWEDSPVDLTDAATFWECFAYVILSLDYGRRGEEWSRAELAGHDFAITRNGHGAGFWDRGLGAIGDTLTDEAKAYGSHSVIIEVDENNDILSTCNI